MKKFLEWFGFCMHKYVIISHNDIVDEYHCKIGHEYTSRCEKCGKIKSTRT